MRKRLFREREIQGILVLDKEVGITSHDLVKQVRLLYRTRRVGHAGTLDPVASGVMVVLVGGATRVAEYIQEDDKEYRLSLLLGRETDTQDITGRILAEKDPSGVTQEDLTRALARYQGSFLQTPPPYSAVKKGGQPLYRLARRGITVSVPPREVIIYRARLLSYEPPRATLHVTCSKGTYMRTLCHDIGRDLGTGGCLESLVRTRSGAYSLSQAKRLSEIAAGPVSPESHLLETASGLSFPRFEPSGRNLAVFLSGRALPWPGAATGQFVSVVRGSELVAVARVEKEGEGLFLVPKKVLEAASTASGGRT